MAVGQRNHMFPVFLGRCLALPQAMLNKAVGLKTINLKIAQLQNLRVGLRLVLFFLPFQHSSVRDSFLRPNNVLIQCQLIQNMIQKPKIALLYFWPPTSYILY